MAALPASAPLTESQRRRGLLVIGISTFFAWGGFFLVIPLVAVHYVDQLGWAAGTIGVVLALRQITQQSSTTLFGVLSDRIGPKPLICTGMVIRAAGFASMAYATSFWLLLGSMLLAGVGGGMFDAPKSAATAELALPEERQRMYALLGVIGGLGVAIGTQVGAFLIEHNFRVVCLAAAVAYLVILAAMWVLLPPLRVSSGANAGSLAGLGAAFRDRVFMRFMFLMSGYWFAWTQFALTITLAATDITGTSAAVSWIYLINTAITIGLGFFLPNWMGRRMRPIDLTIWGMAILALGLATVGVAHSTVMILVAAGIFTIGAIVARPGQETVTANLADPAARGTYFGVAFLSLAFGGGLGSLIGGFAYDFGLRHDLQLAIWLMFGTVSGLCAVGMWRYRDDFSTVRDGAGEVSPAPSRDEPVSTPAAART